MVVCTEGQEMEAGGRREMAMARGKNVFPPGVRARLSGVSCPVATWSCFPGNRARTFAAGEEVRQALLEFKHTYKENRIIQRHGCMTPAQVRPEQSQAWPLAAGFKPYLCPKSCGPVHSLLNYSNKMSFLNEN
uniref:Uncharacterized protein n=1 Tax=Desulfobacca acetoxidans TaxID=60893 RepID=A0A7V4G9U6_9BACT